MTPDHHGGIAKRAYSIWEGEGRPSGKDLDHWLRAEAEMKAARSEGVRTNGRQAEAIPAAQVKRPTARRPRRTQSQ